MSTGPTYIDNAWDAMAMDAITVHPERCTKVRNRNTRCMKCADACTSGCISYEDNNLKIDLSKCVGCGTCATVCPTCALEAHNPTDAELLAVCKRAVQDVEGVEGAEGAASGRRLTIACSQVEAALGTLADSSKLASVVCAGRIDESAICAFASEKVTRIDVLCGDCVKCAQRHGLDTACLVVETSRVLFDAWDVDCEVEVVQEPPAYILQDGISVELAVGALEGYFAGGCACEPIVGDAATSSIDASAAESSAQGECVEATRERDDETHGTGMRFYWESTHSRRVHKNLHVMKDGTLPHFVPTRRDRVLDALSVFGKPSDRELETRLMGTMLIDTCKCVSCRMCAVFCPTGAIRKFDDADGTVGILHTPADCIKCESCKDICPGEAIEILPSVSTGDIFEGNAHRYDMNGRDVVLRNNPHQMLETMRKNIPGDIFER
jgi:formate hydrogenlyase subunit 6/NADH:ubiquinone oxidoreductase subunit I